ncbi:hypothetical protein [Streptomyces sp. A5-4]|uniref:hypothetical protein n=1 Tax=Streptomyces sp. A5-4 TaxID=3384771 RepID=UPI003DA8DE92
MVVELRRQKDQEAPLTRRNGRMAPLWLCSSEIGAGHDTGKAVERARHSSLYVTAQDEEQAQLDQTGRAFTLTGT